VDDEEDRFVVATTGGAQRWVLHRPVDDWGDGHVHGLRVQVGDDGISAEGSSTFEGLTRENLRDFLVGLDRDFRGWQGVRSWTSMEREMTVEAGHDGRVRLAVTLRRAFRSFEDDAWSARIVLTLEAGEELSRLARNADRVLRPRPA
jgi:hypothetical protein